MKLLLLFYVFIQFYLNSFSQINYVKVNRNDCFSCLTQLKLLTQFSSKSKIVFVFKEDFIVDQDELDSIFINDSINQSIVFSDSLYTVFDKFKATSVVVTNRYGNIRDEFTLRNLTNHLPSLFLEDTTYLIDKLPSTFDYKIYGYRLYVFDMVNSRIELFDLNNKYSVKKMDIKTSILKDAYSNYFKDSFSYYKLDTFVKRMKVPPFIKLNQFISFDVRGDTVYVLMESLYPKVCNYKQKADTCFFLMYNLVKFVNGRYAGSNCVRNTVEDTTLIYYYQDYQLNGSKLDVLDSGLRININRTNTAKTNQYIGYWGRIQEDFVFRYPIGPDLPRLSYSYNVIYDLNDYVIKGDYLMHRFSNTVDSFLKPDDAITLKIDNLNNLVEPSDDPYEPKSVNYMVHDFIIEGEIIHLLFALKGTLYYQSFNIAGKSLIEAKSLLYFGKNTDMFRSIPLFHTSNFILLFPSGSNSIIRQRIK
ncbi:MAG: hypothetical protein MUE96_06620 [Bacteroidia bacterium]|nr:hypothetical protein [Bacteroidia bacterium]